MTPDGDEIEQVAGKVIERIVSLSEAIGWQANVGGMETAGSIVSYLAEHPEHLPALMDGTLSVIDWPVGWHTLGCLTWHGMDGKLHKPVEARRQRLIKQLENGTYPEGPHQ